MKTDPKKMWIEYHLSIGVSNPPALVTDKFCDNEKDANELSQLVFRGIKQATSSSLWVIEKLKLPKPKIGNHWLVTDWAGNGVCIVKTTKVTIVKYKDVTQAQAQKEGEGDLSLQYWQLVHRNFFERECFEFGFEFDVAMPLIFEEFQKIFPLSIGKRSPELK